MHNFFDRIKAILFILVFALLLTSCGNLSREAPLSSAVSDLTTSVDDSVTTVIEQTKIAVIEQTSINEMSVDSSITISASQSEAIFTPTLKAEILISGLEHPWDIGQLPDGSLLFTERHGAVSLLKDGELLHIADIEAVLAKGEGGLTGLAIDVDFSENRFVYFAYNFAGTAGPEVKVTRYRLSEANTLDDAMDIVTGIPAISSGRHSGCQLEMGADGALWIGTGDSATSTTPQDPTSLGGKILRVTRDGEPWPGNLDSPFDPRVYSYGHRNTQGLALYDSPKNDSFGFSAEHGSNIEDEINALQPGNFGWAPLPPYNESVPMTDLERFPDALEASWHSGERTIAISGISILKGAHWGTYENWLAVSVLKDRHLRLISLENGKISSEELWFEGEFGRLRASVLGQSDQFLYLTTDNGENDAIIRVYPE